MMKNTIIAVSMAIGLFFAGCASQEKPGDLINDAQSAIDGSGTAKDCASNTYALAMTALEEAKTAQANGDAETAKQKARLAKTLADQAKSEAAMNAEECERQKNAAEALSDKLAPVVDDLANGEELVLDDTFKVIYFDFDESFLTSSAMSDLQSNIDVLKKKPALNVILAAHTDERGTTEYNLALSQKRGDSVKEYVQGMGVSGDRMSVVPYGKEKPAVSGTRDQDYALNRRVEFIAR